MKSVIALCCALLLAVAVRAQAPSAPAPAPGNLPMQNSAAPAAPVPVSEEPHHRLLLQNEFIHVYTVAIPPLDSTFPHTHDLPYVYIVLGPADIVNAVVGQPEAHLTFQDGDVRYSPGHLTHTVRTDFGIQFRNITVELVHPQGTAKNICKPVAPGPLGACPQPTQVANNGKMSRLNKKKPASEDSESLDDDVPYFETDEIRVDLFKVAQGRDYVEATPKMHALLVALTDANLDANLAGEHVLFLHAGDVLWMPAGQHRRVVDFLGTHSSFLLISFKDGTQLPSSQ